MQNGNNTAAAESTVYPTTEANDPDDAITPAKTRLSAWLLRTSLPDLIDTRHHSRDFNGSRAEYIYRRMRLLALVFAGLAPLWIPVDMVLLNGARFQQMLMLRLSFSAALVLLALWTGRPHNLTLARLRVALFIAIPGLFYIGSRLVLNDRVPEVGVLMGYSFLPYLIVSLLAVFPFTVLEGVAYTAAIGAIVAGTEIAFGTLLSVRAFGEIWLLVLLAAIAMWAELAQLHMLLQLYREATRDALTGLVNRAVLNKWLDLEVLRAKERETALSVLLLDLDLFKRINDTYGHLAGDLVLQVFARLLIRELPGVNLIGRYGGEEFLVIMPGKNEQTALELANRIRAACHKTRVRGPDDQSIGFTVSIGVAMLQSAEGAEALLQRVDKGLYRAKEAGRDLAVTA